MNGGKSQDAPWREADVEEVLRDFFRAEMPAELRSLSPRPGNPGSIRPSVPAASPKTGRVSLWAAAAALFVAVSLVLTSSPSGRTPRPSTPAPTPVADMQPVSLNPADDTQLVNEEILSGRRNWHPAVIPVELRKFAPGLLIHSGNMQPKSNSGGFYFPGVEYHDFPDDDDDEEGKPLPRKLPKKK